MTLLAYLTRSPVGPSIGGVWAGWRHENSRRLITVQLSLRRRPCPVLGGTSRRCSMTRNVLYWKKKRLAAARSKHEANSSTLEIGMEIKCVLLASNVSTKPCSTILFFLSVSVGERNELIQVQLI